MIPTNVAAGIRIVVVAAGYSHRLGRSKGLERIRGLTLLRRTVRTVAALAGRPVIVVLPPRAVRARAELRGERVEIAGNRHRDRGLSASVICGLRRARYSSAVLILPVDLAWLERREIERLVARWRGSRRTVVARRVGRRAGAPLILPRRLYPEASRIGGDLGLKDLVNGRRPDELELIALPSAEWDVDTPEDLARARRRIHARRAANARRDSSGTP
jgi:molybdenum cofactor cytidylyltransferase